MTASLTRLQSFYGELKAPLLLHAVIKREFPGTAALLTSFSSDCGLLLAMVAEIDPAIPVLFLRNAAQPPEAFEYGRGLCAQLGLGRLHPVASGPEPEPLAQMLDTMGILALITARNAGKQSRIELDDGGVFRIHPLAGWSEQQRNTELQRRNLPVHPLGDKAGFEADAFAAAPEAIDAPAAEALDWYL